MKLRNPTNRLVNMPTSQGRIVLHPKRFVEMSNLKLRREVEKFVKQFGLVWELDDEDFPPGVDPSRYKGSHAYAKANDSKFDANAVRLQSDAEEVADVWSPIIYDEKTEKNHDEDPMEDLIFIKETVENETSSENGEVGEAALTREAPEVEEEGFQQNQVESSEEVPSEGPEYLREGPPEGVEIFEEEELPKTDYQKIGYAEAPLNCPYTKSQLQLGVKATLWTICSELGLNQDGTKGELINRIFQYYDHNK